MQPAVRTVVLSGYQGAPPTFKFIVQPGWSGTPGGTLTGVDGIVGTGAVSDRYWLVDGVPQLPHSITIDSGASAVAGRSLTFVNEASLGTARIYATSTSTKYGSLGFQRSIPFTGTDGTRLSAYNYGTGTFVRASGTDADATISSGRALLANTLKMTVTELPLSAEQVVYADFCRIGTTNNGGMRLLLRCSDSAVDYYEVSFLTGGTISISRSGAALTLTSGGTWTAPSNGSSQQVYAKATTLTNGDVVVSAGKATGTAIDTEWASVTIDHVSGAANIITAANMIGIGKSTAATNCAWDNLIFQALDPALVLTGASTSVAGGVRDLHVTGTYAGSPTGYDMAVFSAKGATLLDWGAATGTVSSGNLNVARTVSTLESAAGTTVVIALRQSNLTTLYRAMPLFLS